MLYRAQRALWCTDGSFGVIGELGVFLSITRSGSEFARIRSPLLKMYHQWASSKQTCDTSRSVMSFRLLWCFIDYEPGIGSESSRWELIAHQDWQELTHLTRYSKGLT